MEKALRAKAMAEQKIAEMNLDVAQTFSHRGPWTYPQMLKEGLPPIVAPIDVHVTAQKAINSEPDWYGVLVFFSWG